MTNEIKQQVLNKITSGQLSRLESLRLADKYHILEEICQIMDWNIEDSKSLLRAIVDVNLSTMTQAAKPCRGCKRNRTQD